MTPFCTTTTHEFATKSRAIPLSLLASTNFRSPISSPRARYSTSTRASATIHTQPSTTNTKNQQANHLPHLTSTGDAHMMRITAKTSTHRRAIAIGHVAFSHRDTARLVQSALIKKGDVLGTARLAGIMAAKNCPSIIPLCHPIMLSAVRVDVRLSETVGRAQDSEMRRGGAAGGVDVEAEVECTGQTGVEMEALTAVSGACLTVVDMVKGVDRGAKIQEIKVVLKEGGRSGTWRDESWTERAKS